MSLDAILGEDYFARTSGHLLCFGAGGSGKAISLHLINKHGGANRPKRMVVVNRSQPRLNKLREMVESLQTDIRFEYICNDDPEPNDETMESLPPGSVVINATGLGKDRPGSPITDDGLFPQNGLPGRSITGANSNSGTRPRPRRQGEGYRSKMAGSQPAR